MLTSTIRHVFNTRLRFFSSMSLKRHDLRLMNHNCFIKKAAKPTSANCILENRRWYSDMNEKLPLSEPLMGDPVVLCPIIKFLQRSGNVKAIQKELDPDFDLDKFLTISKQCVEIVGQAIATGNYNLLNDLVEKRFLEALMKKIDKLTDNEKQRLHIDFNNIQWHYVTSVDKNQISNDEVEVSINTVFVSGLVEEGDERSLFRGNYEFKQVYKKGIPGSWKLTYFNLHYFAYLS